MILSKSEVKTLSKALCDLEWKSYSEELRTLWDKIAEEMKSGDKDIKIRTKDLALRWGMDKQSIVNMRKADRGPSYIKLDSGTILYDLNDLIEYERLRVIKPKLPI